MKIQIDQKHKALKADLFETISNFDSFENGFGTGNRNSVKKIDLPNLTVVVKSFKIPVLMNQIAYKYIRKSKAKRSYEYTKKLSSLNILSPSPIAYIEYFSWFGLKKSFYISEFLDYDLTIKDLLQQRNHPEFDEILTAFTRFTFKLHEKGIHFLDHSGGNTLVVKNNDNYDFYLVDLNRMKFEPLSFEQRMENFSRLTPKKEMVEIMSREYATLIDQPFEQVFEKMWHYTHLFFNKSNHKKQLKKILHLKKERKICHN
ncbi:Kdo domain containing protein [Aureibaculum sp. A20]|uniref:Kdo domain containing protein n=1 Tax=Aureibaculum flavum TaxID=2795986 RepID=A0ABS0WV18_9FLAO|nr:Kdo domain containing protein [Aureibaculum flavum]MBJ2175780.1 Kdo domain containing protein [Aureibaculum flavum]